MGAPKDQVSFEAYLRQKANWVRMETFDIHRRGMDTRVASSLSCVEIMTALYHGEILRFDPKNRYWDGRDRFVISKGHGSICMYPILADVGFFPLAELKNVCKDGSFLGGIPDPIVPGYETINGSLGHGLGVACGMAFGLKKMKKDREVFVLCGDGEMNEGAIWEAIMFATHHELDNLNIIIDDNKKCMLDYSLKVINMGSLEGKFLSFGCHVEKIDGHDVVAVHSSLKHLKTFKHKQPKVLICDTVKGKGSPKLEASSLCHVLGLSSAEVDEILKRLENE